MLRACMRTACTVARVRILCLLICIRQWPRAIKVGNQLGDICVCFKTANDCGRRGLFKLYAPDRHRRPRGSRKRENSGKPERGLEPVLMSCIVSGTPERVCAGRAGGEEAPGARVEEEVTFLGLIICRAHADNYCAYTEFRCTVVPINRARGGAHGGT